MMCIDLFSGLGGFSEGFLAEGYDCIGFDIERHRYPIARRPGSMLQEWDEYPGQLVLQDVLTIHGSQFKDAACIVASPPCQEFSYLAMPWSRGKAIAKALRGHGEFPKGYAGSRTIAEMTALFDACFRIQREASEAAGRYIPMVVENVKGAQPWVGRAQANYGSFYLWGDVRSVGGRIIAAHRVEFGAPGVRAYRQGAKVPGLDWNGSDKPGYVARAFNSTAEQRLRDGSKNAGGSWFAIGSPGQTNVGQNPDGRKVPGLNFHEHERTGQPGRSFQSAAVDGSKGFVTGLGKGHDWRRDPSGRFNSKSTARKAASAQIAKIPLGLSRFIARSFKPEQEQSV